MGKTTVTRKAVTAMAVAGVLFGAAACGQDDESADVASENASASRAAGAAASAARESDSGSTTTSTTEADEGRTVVVDGASTEGDAQPCEAPAGQTLRGDAPPPSATPEPECRPAGPTPEPELGTGDVQVTLRWESNADVDLHVFEPNGTEIWFGGRGPTETGGQLDVDSNVGCEQEASVENVFWPTGQAPDGDYTVEVTGYQVDGCGSGDYVVTATVRGEVVLEEAGTVGEDETDTYEFEA
jgi:hypothetical protein